MYACYPSYAAWPVQTSVRARKTVQTRWPKSLCAHATLCRLAGGERVWERGGLCRQHGVWRGQPVCVYCWLCQQDRRLLWWVTSTTRGWSELCQCHMSELYHWCVIWTVSVSRELSAVRDLNCVSVTWVISGAWFELCQCNVSYQRWVIWTVSLASDLNNMYVSGEWFKQSVCHGWMIWTVSVVSDFYNLFVTGERSELRQWSVIFNNVFATDERSELCQWSVS